MKDTRHKALLIIDDVLNKGAFLNEQLAIAKRDMSSSDYHLTVAIATGVVQNKLLLTNVIRKHSSLRLKKIHPMILNILMLSVYQLFFLDGVPDHAVVDEGVKLAKRYGNKGSVGFTNAVLRAIVRDKDAIVASEFYTDDLSLVDRLSIQTSHPVTWVEYFLNDHDVEFVEALLRANNQKPEVCIRVNTNKISREALAKLLATSGFKTEPTQRSAFGLRVPEAAGLFETDLFNKGYFYVQDEASMLVAEKADPPKKVLDMCAAPGGKTIATQLCYPDAQIYSGDVSKNKVERLKSNLKRMGLNSDRVFLGNGEIYNEHFKNRFDLVLLDAPCSGLGLIRRKPEIKFNRTPEDIKGLSKIQSRLLSNAAKYVRINGEILYTTCTMTTEENEAVVEAFLNDNPQFVVMPIEGAMTYKLYPHRDGTDGFSMTKLVRVR
ncbi:16S rRNA (cytosine(967)-C(5))-methyltransferase RsmB [Peptoniphilus equinus]|uniref:16S rRNA (cytosine(967)-C(5))-methyltransferase n=1 Tax=Peptoniphilus equinus TaxID=3016343 RepID=A0ABY7QSX0_9FIRM|nr:16S rRNA (cytosine(967)-C(5))-methyltransferase RsmB [Peptoniphilus equinus]WBW49253.1 16S rRNA (cytosine(967)-C(5))-methyltransferase RsmB [Peptoniphilus equinus]